MGKWAWFPLIGSILGALVFIFGSMSAEGAPQEAVAAAAGVALAIIPYVFARAMSEINASKQGNLRRIELARLIAIEMSDTQHKKGEQEAESHQIRERQSEVETQGVSDVRMAGPNRSRADTTSV